VKGEVNIVKANIKRHSNIYLVPLGDFHWDEPQSDHEAIQDYVRWIAGQDNAYTILVGDLFTMTTKTSAADIFEMGEPAQTIELVPPDQTLNELTELLKPIAGKILASCSGNHELKNMFRVVGADYNYRLMHDLGIEERYSRDGGVLYIKTKPLSRHDKSFFSIVYIHGWGGARTRGAKIRKLEFLTNAIHADCYVMGHDHTQNLARDNYLTTDNFNADTVGVHRKLLVNTGAFRKYAGYPLRSGYAPSDLGTPRIELSKKEMSGSIKKDIHASL
jgi:hypothetical protein